MLADRAGDPAAVDTLGFVSGKGLADVVAAETKISDIDGKLGKLWYAGYSIDDLAEHSSFEEVLFLLHHVRLPTQAELDALIEQMVEYREASDFLSELIRTNPKFLHTFHDAVAKVND